jgi:Right handed beta helix region
MQNLSRTLFVGATVVGTAVAALGAAIPGSAEAAGPPPPGAPAVVFVAANGGAGSSCQHASYTAIQPAIEAVALGGIVVVCPGTYPGMVNVDRRVTLSGEPGATIDATGDVYGIGVSASWSTVTGMNVMNASPLDAANGLLADGIVTIAIGAQGPAAADHVQIVGNDVTGNLGSGIDINSSSYSTASFNVADGNGVGINVSDDLGLPADHNTVTANRTDENFGGCGIALADHSGAGVSNNLVAFNTSDDNGLATSTAPFASAGSGVILASPIPGGDLSGNTITLNEFSGNGHGGVVVHAHAPGDNYSGDTVAYNRIGTNNLRNDENDTATTGVYLGSASPLSITVTGNIIGPDYYGIFASGPVTVTGGSNVYYQVTNKMGTSPSF